MWSKLQTINLTWQPTVIIVGLAIILAIISSIWPEAKAINTKIWCYATIAILLTEAGVGLIEQLSSTQITPRSSKST